jgi:hypothetical protein
MSQREKIIQSMKQNPKKDWCIEDLKKLAHQHNIDYRQPGSSHVTFRTQTGNKLTVPARRPIKPVYIKLFVELLESKEGTDVQ